MKSGIIFLIVSFSFSYSMECPESAGMLPSFAEIDAEFDQSELAQDLFLENRRLDIDRINEYRRLAIARGNEELYAQNQEVPQSKCSNGKRVEFCLTVEQIEKLQQRAQEEEKRKEKAAKEKVALERSEFERKVRAEKVPEFTKKIIELIKREDEEVALVQLKEWLEEQDGNLEARTVDGCTPLMEAVERQKLSFVHVLVMHGANINARESWNGNVLGFAVGDLYHWTPDSKDLEQGKKMISMCRFLLSKGAQMDAKVFERANASHTTILAFLVRHYLQIPEQQPVKSFKFDAERLSNLKIAVTEANSHCWRMGYHPLEEFWYKKDDFAQSVRALLHKWPLNQEPFL